jgi:hypothetical protein
VSYSIATPRRRHHNIATAPRRRHYNIATPPRRHTNAATLSRDRRPGPDKHQSHPTGALP